MKLISVREVESFPLYDITVDNRHCFKLANGVIAHNSMDKYSPQTMGGGGGIVYAANQIFMITKAVHKGDEGIEGFKFTLVAEKSRYVKEKSKFPFNVMFNGGIQKWSTLFDLAVDFGALRKPSMGWYEVVDLETGEIIGAKRRAKDIEKDDVFFEGLIKNDKFKAYIEKKYKISGDFSAQQAEAYQLEMQKQDEDDEDEE